ncbi:MAG: hypothetical protein U1E76_26840 [Planctomycetota bacterium]
MPVAINRRTIGVLAILCLGLAPTACIYLGRDTKLWLGIREEPEHILELQFGNDTRFAVSTEDGILCLAEDALRSASIPFRFRYKRGIFEDRATVDRINENLAILLPQTSNLYHVRFGAYPAREDDELYLGVYDSDERPYLLRVALYQRGQFGDLLEVPIGNDEAAAFADRFRGVGLYAWRDDYYQLVGILNGVYTVDRPIVAFIGLEEIARILPTGSHYFERKIKVPRPDFEYGIIEKATNPVEPKQ